MLNESEEGRLVKEITKLCKINDVDEQVIDFEHLINRGQTYEENYNKLKDMFNLKDKNDMLNYAKSTEAQMDYEKWHTIKEDGLSLFEIYKPFCIAIIGSRNSGKTALGHQIGDKLRIRYQMPVYVYKYPKIKLINKLGYRNIKELRSLEHMERGIFWLDEPQITLKRYDKRNNDILEELLSICRHREIILIISTSDTRWINKALESYVDVWCIKDIDCQLIKNGSRAKNIIKQYATLDADGFKLENNEYLLYYRKDEEYQGRFDFKLPLYWSDEYSRPYKNTKDIANEIPKDKNAR